MKTTTFGKTCYVVEKYYRDKKGQLQMTTRNWSSPEKAFEECELHRKKHGIDMAFVLKAKLCRKA